MSKRAVDVVILHFGGPTCEEQVQPFLRRLFEDPFIIRAPLGVTGRKWLASYISKKRWKHTNEQYKAIGYSPINHYTKIQADFLEQRLKADHPESKVFVVNRYTEPFAPQVIPEILKSPAERPLFLLTLYPHFSHSTAGSSIRDFDQAWEAITGTKTKTSHRVFHWWWQRRYREYALEFLKEAVSKHQTTYPGQALSVLYSAHGLPQKYADRGDPYVHDIRAHAEELSLMLRSWAKEEFGGQLDLSFDLSFQSRVGPVEWLRPYTEDKIEELGNKRGGTLLIVPLSFVSDHIETLYEMDVTYRNLALSKGFKNMLRARVPNEDPKFAVVLYDTLIDMGLYP